MKGCFIHFDQNIKNTGVGKKINSQLKVLRNYYETKEINVQCLKRTFLRKIICRLPLCSIQRDYKSALKEIKDSDFVIIRRAFADRDYYNFIKHIKINNKNIKVLVEIYTYPYDRDDFSLKKGLNCLFFPKDFFYRNKLKKYVDRYITYSNDDKIFNVKTIKTVNGIDFSRINTKKSLKDHTNINIIAVGLFQNHSGFDRVLTGLGNYYRNGGKRYIHIFFIGKELESCGGQIMSKYRNIIEDYNLLDNITFCGFLNDEQQNEYFDKCDLALASFGMHRDKVFMSSDLKSRNYLAKGIPIISGCKMDILSMKNNKFYLEFPADESIINFNEIITFHDSLYNTNEDSNLINEIRLYGERNCSIETSMSPIINYLKENQ